MLLMTRRLSHIGPILSRQGMYSSSLGEGDVTVATLGRTNSFRVIFGFHPLASSQKVFRKKKVYAVYN